jgi:3-deoxy-D-manno-octulosonic acid kinase
VKGDPRLPEGFVAARGEEGALLVADGPARLAELLAAGLDEPRRWEELLAAGARPAGRGRAAVLRLEGGDRLRLKRLRRGGWARALWRDRFRGTARALGNLEVAHEARRRGLPTPRIAALCAVEGPRGLYRAWLAAEQIDDAADLAARARGGGAPSRAEWAAVTATVRTMHDAGIEHRDLNLGNLLMRGAGATAEVFVVDLDAARLAEGPLPFVLRRRALRRLERSWVKERGPATDRCARDWIYETYAADDLALAQRLARGRRAGSWLIRLHRLAWRRSAARH